jgi:hypothetical protein
MNEWSAVIHGNCHAANFAKLLVENSETQVAYLDSPFSFMRSLPYGRIFYITPQYCQEWVMKNRAKGRKIVLIEQLSPMAPAIAEELRGWFDAIILFPHIEVQAYFPHLYAD